MVPREDGYYWVKLNSSADQQVVRVLKGNVLFMGLQCRISREEIDREYPKATWSMRIEEAFEDQPVGLME